MIQSMTGFGRGVDLAAAREITVEIKAVNHRYSEIQVKLPRKYVCLEEKLRRYVADQLRRGKVDVFVKVEMATDADQAMHVDKKLAVKYHSKIKELAAYLNIPMDLGVSALLQLPGVLTLDETEEDLEATWVQMQASTDQALSQLLAMRQTEGEKLAGDFRQRLAYLESLRQQLEIRSPLVVLAYGQRLNNRIKELLDQSPVDEMRMAAETALFADRASVDEELVRLASHFQQFAGMLQEKQAVGRKLDFLCQEMNREVNTVGSKANDGEMTGIVIEMKSELEKLREQVQNIE